MKAENKKNDLVNLDKKKVMTNKLSKAEKELRLIRRKFDKMTPFAKACFLKSNVQTVQLLESIVEYEKKNNIIN